MKTVSIKLSSLEIALDTAIDAKRKEEEEANFTSDSELVSKWQEVLDGIRAGEFPIVHKEGMKCCGR